MASALVYLLEGCLVTLLTFCPFPISASLLPPRYKLDWTSCETSLFESSIDPSDYFRLSAHFQLAKQELVILRDVFSGNLVGSLVFKTAYGRIVRIDGFKIYDPDLRRKGLGRALLRKLLEKHPSIDSVVFHLTDDNREAMEEALFEQAFEGRRDCLEAFRRTPAYRHFLQLGFLDWTGYCDDHDLVYAFWGRKR
jgi:GNAT superfamily N-acetyltransferase